MSFRNPVRAVWDEGRPALNGWIAAPSVLGVQAMAAAGWDAMTVDMQHGTADYNDLLMVLPVIESSGAAPMVRVPWLDEAAIMRALDAGALGIIAPMIDTGNDAARLVDACRYPPAGRRSFGPVRSRLVWPGYFESADREILVWAMIETQEGLAALEEIASVPGLDGIYIGPADLSLSHGLAPGFDRQEPEMRARIDRIRDVCHSKGLRCALHCGTVEYALEAAKGGMDLVTVGSDARFIEQSSQVVCSKFRDRIGSTDPGTEQA